MLLLTTLSLDPDYHLICVLQIDLGGVQPVVRCGGPHFLSLKLKVGNLAVPWIELGWCRGDGLPLLTHHLQVELMMSLKKPDNPWDCQLRVGSLNVGTMSGRDGELADIAGRRGLDFCCFQETRCRGEANKWLGQEGI